MTMQQKSTGIEVRLAEDATGRKNILVCFSGDDCRERDLTPDEARRLATDLVQLAHRAGTSAKRDIPL